MEIESDPDVSNQELDIEPLSLKTDKRLVLTREAESIASSIFSRRTRVAELNRNLDPDNSAQRLGLALKTKDLASFQHFLTKNKHRHERSEVFTVLR